MEFELRCRAANDSVAGVRASGRGVEERPGPYLLGQDNQYVYSEILGFSDDEIAHVRIWGS